MKEQLKSGIKEFDEAIEKFENGEINFVEFADTLWYKGFEAGYKEAQNEAGEEIQENYQPNK